MLMQVNSGLTRYEVQKAKLALPEALPMKKPHLAIAPALLVALGGACLLDASAGMQAAVVVLMVLGSLLVGAHLCVQRVLSRFDNDRTEVLVIREGLIRPRLVRDLVPGDTLWLAAGSIVPVDVALPADQAVLKGPLAWLLRGLHIALPHDQVIAGSQILSETQTTVLATGAKRFALVHLGAALTTNPGIGCLSGVIALITACKFQLRVGQARFGLHLTQITQLVTRQVVAWIDTFNAHMTLVGHLQHHAKQVAFQYNQDPVSWRLI
ncbi:hypothetical protein ACFQ5J_03410 [Lacticaseibacillus baoqingensis]|uniref:Uncharacterized protein n=1 Tax=Lacticaseibacillus baoqingensis TaxID=2486013 RepID=A0ABW4E4S5_9LACO|nr:hypothetical protein [Lacticaseibacillus baoqingensis]